MDGLYYTIMIIMPLLLLALKAGIMFTLWGLIMALTNLAKALTQLINVKISNEADR